MPIKEFTIRPTSFFLLPFLGEGMWKSQEFKWNSKPRTDISHVAGFIYLWHVFEMWHICLKALIRNVIFPPVQNFLHIYAEQDLRAPNTVMEPWGLNKMSTRILIELKLFAAASWRADVLQQVNVDVQLGDGHSQTARKSRTSSISFLDHN